MSKLAKKIFKILHILVIDINISYFMTLVEVMNPCHGTSNINDDSYDFGVCLYVYCNRCVLWKCLVTKTNFYQKLY